MMNLKFEVEYDNTQKEISIEEFEQILLEVIRVGAKNRTTAIRWIKSQDPFWADDEQYMEYCLNLPYGYLQIPCQ